MCRLAAAWATETNHDHNQRRDLRFPVARKGRNRSMRSTIRSGCVRRAPSACRMRCMTRARSRRGVVSIGSSLSSAWVNGGNTSWPRCSLPAAVPTPASGADGCVALQQATESERADQRQTSPPTGVDPVRARAYAAARHAIRRTRTRRYVRGDDCPKGVSIRPRQTRLRDMSCNARDEQAPPLQRH